MPTEDRYPVEIDPVVQSLPSPIHRKRRHRPRMAGPTLWFRMVEEELPGGRVIQARVPPLLPGQRVPLGSGKRAGMAEVQIELAGETRE